MLIIFRCFVAAYIVTLIFLLFSTDAAMRATL